MIRQKNIKLIKNPIEYTNPISRICFWWVIGFFRKGINRDLEINDLYEPARYDRSELLGEQLEREWERELAKEENSLRLGKKNTHYKPSLILCLIRIFFRSFTFQGLLMFIQYLVCVNLRTVLLGQLITYFEPGSLIPKSQAYWYATGIIATTALSVTIGNHVRFGLQRIGMQIRIACSSLIYRKIMRLSKKSLDQSAGGQIVNLLSNDVHRFDFLPSFIHFIWIMPIEMGIVTYLVWENVGVSFLSGLSAIILQTIPIQAYISKLSGKLRAEIAKETDKRIKIMSEIISRIKIVKMYAWEKYFQRIVNGVRRTEMKFISSTSYCRGLYLSIFVFASQTALFVTIFTFILTGNNIDPKIVYTTSSYYRLSQFLTCIAFPQAIIYSSEALVSIRRIEEYLHLEETTVRSNDSSRGEKDLTNVETGIIGEKLFATWIQDTSPPVLQNLNFQVSHGQLCALVGSIGSGKSSTLQLILGELLITNGILDIKGKSLSYASQEAWLFGGTIRDNILFGLPYLKNKYDEVTKVCALDTDFRQLPKGHMTFVGERGMTLSGGQRARIHLARAVYRDADIYLIDDPLSAVDTRVGKIIFEKCIAGYLKGKTRIIVTHHLQYLEKTDTIIVLKNGTVQSQCTFENLISTDTDFARSVDTGHHGDEVESNDTLCRRSSTRISTSSRLISAVLSGEDESEVIVDEEKIVKRKLSSEVYKRYFLAAGSICLRCSVILSVILSQVTSISIDYWLAFWINEESIKKTLNVTDFSVNSSRSDVTGSIALDTVDPSIEINLESLFTIKTSLIIYAGTVFSCIVLVLTRGFLVMKMCLNASKTLHGQMFDNLMQAKMQFFDSNPAGRILNRFSKDIGGIDEMLPTTLLQSITLLSIIIGSLTMIIICNYWMIIPIVFIIWICLIAKNYYLSIIQDITRLEGSGKSTMFSHVNYSIEGLLTVRSIGAQEMMIKEFDDCQNLHTSAAFMSIAAVVTSFFYLNTIMVIFLGIVCYTFVIFNDVEETVSVDVGLSIAHAFTLADLLQFVSRNVIQTAIAMIATERVIQYTDLPREGPFVSNGTNKPPPSWPQFGAIEMQNLSLKYADEESPVLKNINIKISPREKIGIVGRTGAGKSSLVAALFRLVKFEGSLTIDGIDTKKIGLNDLRSKISIIPQEPSLFSATIRQNLDPFDEFSDDYLWDALDELRLKGVIASLDFEVEESGSNLSIGERQLICIARAVLKNNKIVVLDEATANMDSTTDALIQMTVRQKFADCTVLTIAHRLSTVMDNDRVLVLQAGQVVEFDHPYKLLQNPRGHLTSMVKGTGPATAERLTGIARMAYDQREIMETTKL